MNQALILPDPNNAPQVQDYYVKTINFWLDQYRTSGTAAVNNLMGAMAAKHIIGVTCLALKEKCNHGEFMKLRSEHFPALKERTAGEWQARAERDMAASVALREATNAVINAPSDDAVLQKFSEVANEYFRTKSTLLKQGADEIGLLGWRKPSEPAAPRAKLPRGKNADIARREFETKSRLCFSTLVREVEKAATLKLGEAHCWDVDTTDAQLEELDRALVVIRTGLKSTLEKRKALKKAKR